MSVKFTRGNGKSLYGRGGRRMGIVNHRLDTRSTSLETWR